MKKKSFAVLTPKLVSNVFMSRIQELADQRVFILRVLTTCPGALEALCKKRLGVAGLPPIPQGNPLSQHWQIEDIIHYFGLKFTAEGKQGVLTRNGGGHFAYWNNCISKWIITKAPKYLSEE